MRVELTKRAVEGIAPRSIEYVAGDEEVPNFGPAADRLP